MHWIVKFNHKIDIAAAKAQILHNGRCCCCNYTAPQCRLYMKVVDERMKERVEVYEWNEVATSGCCREEPFKLYISLHISNVNRNNDSLTLRCYMTGR